MKIIKGIIFIIIYAVLGTVIEHFGIIEKPAWWTLYGAFWGIIVYINLQEIKRSEGDGL